MAHEGPLKREWALTPAALRRLLSWLDEGNNSEGQQYNNMRRRLWGYFARKGCPSPDDLVDLTMNRVARRLEEEDLSSDENPARYCFITARFVFMEHLRDAQKDRDVKADLERHAAAPESIGRADEAGLKERMLNCLDRCAGTLEPRNRDVIMRYYAGRERTKIENRRALAASLGVTMNALSIRAHRIREKLEACVRKCLAQR